MLMVIAIEFQMSALLFSLICVPVGFFSSISPANYEYIIATIQEIVVYISISVTKLNGKFIFSPQQSITNATTTIPHDRKRTMYNF